MANMYVRVYMCMYKHFFCSCRIQSTTNKFVVLSNGLVASVHYKTGNNISSTCTKYESVEKRYAKRFGGNIERKKSSNRKMF